MPTATYRQLYNWIEERGDLAFGRPPWAGEGGDAALLALPYNERVGLNAYGVRSQTTAPGNASADDGAGYLQSGVRYYAPKLNPQISVTCNPSEGCHEKTGGCVFQVGLKPGENGVPVTGVTSAVIRPKARTNRPVVVIGIAFAQAESVIKTGGRDVAAFKIYGIAHDDFRPGRRTDGVTGYNQTYWNQWNHHIPYRGFPSMGPRQRGHFAMRYYADSAPADMEHTDAVLRLEFPVSDNAYLGPVGWESGNIADIVNEIILRPGWRAGNKLCICMANDGTYDHETPVTILTRNPPTYAGGDYAVMFAQSVGKPFLWWRFENTGIQFVIDLDGMANPDGYSDWELVLTY